MTATELKCNLNVTLINGIPVIYKPIYIYCYYYCLL